MPEPQTLFTVVAPVASGRPAPRACLPRRRLPLARRQHATDQSFIDTLRRKTGPLHGRANNVRPQGRSLERRKISLEAT